MTAPTSDDGALDLRWEKTVGQFADLAALFADIRLSLSQTQAAAALGLPNADALRRLLLKRRLPPYRLLRDWYYVSLMVERAMANDRPGHWAMHRGDFANVYYRFVEKLTGLRWKVVLRYGLRWVQARALGPMPRAVQRTLLS